MRLSMMAADATAARSTGPMAAASPRIAAREGQQLLDQVDGTLDGASQALARFGACFFIWRAIEELQLQAQGGERRPQFMGRVGDERALRGECGLQTRQAID